MECLNLDYHIKRLLLIAIAKYKNKTQQAKALGISRPRFDNLKKKYHL